MSDGKANRSLTMRFERATKRAFELPTRPSNEKLLEMYALYKQANEGDCEGKPRGGLRERAKWKAWKSVAGTTKAEAMERYCEIVDTLMG